MRNQAIIFCKNFNHHRPSIYQHTKIVIDEGWVWKIFIDQTTKHSTKWLVDWRTRVRVCDVISHRLVYILRHKGEWDVTVDISSRWDLCQNFILFYFFFWGVDDFFDADVVFFCLYSDFVLILLHTYFFLFSFHLHSSLYIYH